MHHLRSFIITNRWLNLYIVEQFLLKSMIDIHFVVTASNMANPKEKTPMCLVNELARYNKIQPEYKLLSEQGPAHSKVLLTLICFLS